MHTAHMLGDDAPVERVSIEGFGSRQRRRESRGQRDLLVLEDQAWDRLQDRALADVLEKTIGRPDRFDAVKKEWDVLRGLDPVVYLPRGREELLMRARQIKRDIEQNMPEHANVSWLRGI